MPLKVGEMSIVAVLVLCLFLCLAIIFWGVSEYNLDRRNGPCIRTQPPIVVSGLIHASANNLFHSGYVLYTLYYSGTYEHSGEECRSSSNVTEAEYDRQMYREHGCGY